MYQNLWLSQYSVIFLYYFGGGIFSTNVKKNIMRPDVQISSMLSIAL